MTLIETSMHLTTCISGHDQNGGLFEQHSITVLFSFVFFLIFFPSLSRVLVLAVQVQL